MAVVSLNAARQKRAGGAFADNVEHQFFNSSERAALENLIEPYFHDGLITDFTYKRGPDNSAFFAKWGKRDKDVVFCVCKLGGDGVHKYGVNLGTPDAFETVNFSDVLSHVRPVLEKLEKSISAKPSPVLAYVKG